MANNGQNLYLMDRINMMKLYCSIIVFSLIKKFQQNWVALKIWVGRVT